MARDAIDRFGKTPKGGEGERRPIIYARNVIESDDSSRANETQLRFRKRLVPS